MQVSPASRFGTQRGNKLRAADDLETGETREGRRVVGRLISVRGGKKPENQTFQRQEFLRRRRMTQGDHADAYPHLPRPPEGETSRRGCITESRWWRCLVSSAFHYICFSRLVASLACRTPRLPRIGCTDNLGATAQLGKVPKAFWAITEPKKSEAGPRIGLLGIAIQLSGYTSDAKAKPSLPGERAHRLTQVVDGTS